MAFLPLVAGGADSQHDPMSNSQDHGAPATEIILFDGFDDIDGVVPFEILTAAGFPVRAVGFPAGTGMVTSAHGLGIEVTADLGPAPDLVVIPGGGWNGGHAVGVRSLASTPLPERLAELHSQGTVLASVCTGAMVLAASGVLAGRPAVTHRTALDDLAGAGADVRADARVVDDGSVVTSGGPAAGIDLALRLVERFLGPAAVELAAERLEHQRVGPTLVNNAMAA
jgi:transcriptional regulator GlxA family with amidase domain